MSLITDTTKRGIDTTAIKKGDLIRAKYHRWPEARNGIVAAVRADLIKVLYIPPIGNVTNYFNILAKEIDLDLWEITWSGDFEDINVYQSDDSSDDENADEGSDDNTDSTDSTDNTDDTDDTDETGDADDENDP